MASAWGVFLFNKGGSSKAFCQRGFLFSSFLVNDDHFTVIKVGRKPVNQKWLRLGRTKSCVMPECFWPELPPGREEVLIFVFLGLFKGQLLPPTVSSFAFFLKPFFCKLAVPRVLRIHPLLH